MTIIPLGRALPRASSHLPADSVGHVVVCLLGVAPRRDWPFHFGFLFRSADRMKPAVGTLRGTDIVTVPLILASRRTGVTRYAALWSPDFPLCGERRTATVWLASRVNFTAEVLRVVVERFVTRLRVPSGNPHYRHWRHRLRR